MLRANVEPATYSPMPSDVGLQADGHVHKASRVNEQRRWFFIGLDDARWDYVNAVLSGSCARSGQLAMQTLHDEVIDKGTSYTSHRTTLGPCWTARAEWHSGLFFLNHGMTAESTISTGYISDWADNYVDGHKTTRPHGSTSQWQGPWGKDLAYQAGYGRQRVTHATQTTDGVLRDSDDDVQAFSGGIWQQLDREGVHVAFVGKMSNPRDRTDPVPAGIRYFVIQLEDGPNSPVTDNAQYNLWYQSPSATPGAENTANLNEFDGDGYNTLGGYYFRAYEAKPITSITNPSFGTIRFTVGAGAFQRTVVGDEITISGNTSGYDGTYTVTNVPDDNHADVASLNATLTGGGNVFLREVYAPFLYWNNVEAWLETKTDATPFFVNITTRLPHDNNSSYNASTHEKEYEDCVAEADAQYWLGVAAGISPVQSSLSAGEKEAWADSMQMMASMNDMLRRLIDYSDNRYGPDGYGIMFTSDQGIQNGDQGSSYTNADGDSIPNRGDGGGKIAVWDSSARAMMYIRGPGFAEGATISRPTAHADVAPTLLDLFDITDSHWHTTRDGRSLLRVMDSGDVAYDRVLPVFGEYKLAGGGANRGWAFVDQHGRKFIELNNTKSTGHFVWPSETAGAVTYNSVTFHPSYEQKEVSPTSGDLTAYDDVLDTVMQSFRFDTASESNPSHTTASP